MIIIFKKIKGGTHLESANLVVESQKGIMNRLVECLYREKTIPFQEETPHELTYSFPSGAYLTIHLKRKYRMNRFDLDSVFWIKDGLKQEISDPRELLNLLKKEGLFPFSSFDRFYKEIDNSIHNYAIAMKKFDARMKELDLHSNSIDWCLKQTKTEHFSPLAFFEQLIVHGHTLHPCTKTKLGFSSEEVVRYSPECGGEPPLSFVAIKHDLIKVTSLEEQLFCELLYQQFPNLKASIQKELIEKGLDWRDYDIIPVHPWQLKHTIPTMYEEELRNKEIVILSKKVYTYALASLRTLLPKEVGRKALFHIKTAINVQATSAVRTVSPPSTIHGPKLSALFTTILEKETSISQKLHLLKEYGGAYFQKKNAVSKDQAFELGKNLAAIIRQNPEELINFEKNEIAIPAVSLICESPFSKKPILLELIDQYKKSNNIESYVDSIKGFLASYAKLCFETLIPLMSKYGVSFEAHLQNSIPIFKDGTPIRLIVRDYGGIKVNMNRLNKQGLLFSFEKDTHIQARKDKELHQTLSHALIQNHLGELIICIARHMNMDEKELWKVVRNQLDHVFDSFKDVNEKDKHSLLNPTIYLKSLVKMRLRHSIDNEYVEVDNPLVERKEAVR